MTARREPQTIPAIVAIIGIVAFAVLVYLVLGFVDNVLEWFRSLFGGGGTPVLAIAQLIAS